ncbi:MAG: tetratricopeptide repeat protein [Candidatus Krumholzibacteria bacterium]|nr:tetratricopeptide repeat protein [Candidatus Krumholzibacteria bacterium]
MTVLTVCALVLVTGCAPQLDRIEVSVQNNRDEISRMQVENKKMLQEVQALGQLLRMDRDAGDESSAMRLTKLSQVSTRLDQLLQKLDDNAEYMRDLSARVDLLATRQGIPTLGEYKPPAATSAGVETLPEEGRSIFEMAELDRNRGNIALAKAGFEEFLFKYGNSELSDDALYLLGDLSYGEGEDAAALDYFEDMLKRFPASEKAPAAMYKSRSCLLNLGRKDEAGTMGSTLVERYPDSEEAALLLADTGGD